MAIVKGIESGATLAKFMNSKEYAEYVRDQDGRLILEDCGRKYKVKYLPRYYKVYLHNRRERTSGCAVPSYLAPYMKALGIKLEGPYQASKSKDYELEYWAVGCRARSISEEHYNRVQISPEARTHYSNLTNQETQIFLKEEEFICV